MQRFKKQSSSKQTPREQSTSGRKGLTRQQKAAGVRLNTTGKPGKNAYATFLANNLQEGGKKYLSGYSYKEAHAIVNKSIKDFWAENKVPGKCLKLIESKPHTEWRGDCTIAVSGRGANMKLEIPKELLQLEQVDEASKQLFDIIINQVSKAHLVALQNVLTAITIRTLSNESKAVIFQVKETSKKTIQNIKSIDQFLTREVPIFSCSYILIASSRSACHLESPLPLGHTFRKISGTDTIEVGPNKLHIHPLEFFRTNRSVLSEMNKKVAEMLTITDKENLIDLYSGSANWTFLSGEQYERTWSVDIKKYSRDGFSVNSGIQKKRNGSFVMEKVSSEFLKRFIPDTNEIPTTVIIDPPVPQLDAGILRTIADKQVKKVVHIFNDINCMPEEIRKWRKHGYILKKVIPFDSKPFSGQPECIALLTVDYLGLLDKTAPKKKKQIKSAPAANTTGIRFVQD